MDYNKVILAGRLTRETELSFTPSQTPVCQFGLAIGRSRKDKTTGQEIKETTFVDCVSFGKQAETIHQYFSKGMAILIDGRLKFESWQDKQNGQQRTKLKVIVEGFQFVERKQQAAQEPLYAPQTPPGAQAPAQQPAYEPPQIPDDSIPFK